MKSEELRPLIDRFYRGSSGSAEERVKLFKLIWDAMGSEFGARHEWYERNYGGSAELVRLDALRFGKRGGAAGGVPGDGRAVHVRLRPGRVDRGALGVRAGSVRRRAPIGAGARR